MCIDKGQRAWASTKRGDKERGGPTKMEDRQRALMMDIGGRREHSDGHHEGGRWHLRQRREGASVTDSISRHGR